MGRYKFYECEETGRRFVLKDARPRLRGRHHPNQPGKVERIVARRREPKATALPAPPAGKVAPTTRAEVLAVGLCAFCGSVENLTVDHIIPQSKGGGHHRSNLQCLCRPCNRWKNDTILTPEQYHALSKRARRRMARAARRQHALRSLQKERKES